MEIEFLQNNQIKDPLFIKKKILIIQEDNKNDLIIEEIEDNKEDKKEDNKEEVKKEEKLKKCSKCFIFKALDQFQNNKCSTATHDSNGNRLQRPECKTCTTKDRKGRDAAYILANKPIAPEIGTPCDLCNKPGTDRFPTLRFDHDHDSLKHRGWLCDTCNRSLGPLGDNVVSMVNIINYMNKIENKNLYFNYETKKLDCFSKEIPYLEQLENQMNLIQIEIDKEKNKEKNNYSK